MDPSHFIKYHIDINMEKKLKCFNDKKNERDAKTFPSRCPFTTRVRPNETKKKLGHRKL